MIYADLRQWSPQVLLVIAFYVAGAIFLLVQAWRQRCRKCGSWRWNRESYADEPEGLVVTTCARCGEVINQKPARQL